METKGNLHPITSYLREAIAALSSLGFEIYEGPEIDSEWNNFDALNIPADHPSRDMQDTFWTKDGKVLRTQTSNCQVRYGKHNKPPFAIVVPGKIYRNESTDKGHENTFTQLEGLYVDKDVNLGHLKYALIEYFKKMFGPKIPVRFRPSYFPFVEPGLEVDVKFNGKWFELLGAGMTHPKVLKNMGIDPNKYSGFAFGMGIERQIMVKYGISDIRSFRSGDLRFLKQF